MVRMEKWGIAEIGFSIPIEKAHDYIMSDPNVPAEVLEAIEDGTIKSIDIWSTLKEIRMA